MQIDTRVENDHTDPAHWQGRVVHDHGHEDNVENTLFDIVTNLVKKVFLQTHQNCQNQVNNRGRPERIERILDILNLAIILTQIDINDHNTGDESGDDNQVVEENGGIAQENNATHASL